MKLAEILHRLRLRLGPQTHDFFSIFSDQMVVIGEALQALVKSCEEGKIVGQDVGARIKSDEQACDALTKRIIRLVQETFITPIDREDIYALAVADDNIMDEIYRAVMRLADYRTPLDPALIRLIEILQACVAVLQKEFTALRTLDKSFAACVDEIRPLEHEADELERRMIRESYLDVRQILAEAEGTGQPSASRLVAVAFDEHARLRQRREIAEILERAVDNCNRVHQIIGNIYVKHG
jgi:uncharacterized protein Yka (UPF0111/DUF47 family)